QGAASSLDTLRTRGQEAFHRLYRDHQQRQQCRHMAACRDWSALEAELRSEAGVWGSVCSRGDQTWELSPCEGPWRIRKRLRPVQREAETSTVWPQ
ncbi:hypothetical protein FKM82_030518, partial [Ascaphus truei]